MILRLLYSTDADLRPIFQTVDRIRQTLSKATSRVAHDVACSTLASWDALPTRNSAGMGWDQIVQWLGLSQHQHYAIVYASHVEGYTF